MRPTVSTGDLALVAQPATKEGLEPYGVLLAPGRRAWLGRRGRVLLAMDRSGPEPRRRTHLTCYPEARRVWLPAGGAGAWLVVRGREGDATAEAFLLPPGQGVVIEPGIWHAGPVPLEESPATEMIEAHGPADRLDHRSLRELVGVEAVRVLLPEEPSTPTTGLDLATDGAVRIDPALEGRLRLALVALTDVQAAAVDEAVAGAMERTVAGLRTMWGGAEDLREVPGIALGRDLARALDIEPEDPPPGEALLARVLAGEDPEPRTALEAIRQLVLLRTLAPLALYDLEAIGEEILLRPGSPQESFTATDRERRPLEGRPVLVDAAGPFGGPGGDAARAAPGPRTAAILAVFFLPPATDDGTADGLLDVVTKALATHARARPMGRLLVG